MGESVSSSPQSLENYFNELFAYMLAIGMSYDEFWYKEPSLVKTFLKAHEIRQKQDNERMWLQGYYNFMAVSTALSNAFAKKGSSPTPYLKKPLDLTGEDAIKERNERIMKFRDKLISISKK